MFFIIKEIQLHYITSQWAIEFPTVRAYQAEEMTIANPLNKNIVTVLEMWGNLSEKAGGSSEEEKSFQRGTERIGHLRGMLQKFSHFVTLTYLLFHLHDLVPPPRVQSGTKHR